MSRKFLVKCIDNSDTPLILNKYYNAVTDITNSLRIMIAGENYYLERFELIKSFNVICKNNVGASMNLEINKIYTIYDMSEYDFYIDGIGWSQTRFQLTDEQIVVSTVKTFAKAPDLSDWKQWRDVLRKPNHCPCNIVREQCKYHS